MAEKASLNTTVFVNAIQRLAEGLTRYQLDENDSQIRDGLIQRFEFTYEISHKIIKRYLTQVAPSPTEFDNADFQYLIRSANEHGLLLGDWNSWKRYRDMRSRTSHTYNEAIAFEVIAEIPSFLNEVEFLADQLGKRLS